MAEESRAYHKAWEAMGLMLERGGSWSGQERNVAFLNTGDGRFSEAAALLGLDFDDDARAVAVVDWDGDGDMDLWVANRTGPRIRLLRNEVRAPGASLALRLRGERANRDGIGARVEVRGTGGRLLNWRTLRAGEGYLAQSTKWLTFALPEDTKRVSAAVRWPGGVEEVFPDLEVRGSYLLREGTGVGTPWRPERRDFVPGATVLRGPAARETARIVPHSPLPVPGLRWTDDQGRARTWNRGSAKGTVLLLWATWCPACLVELGEWKGRADEVRRAGLEVIVLNVDDPDSPLEARRSKADLVLKRLGLPFEAGFAGLDFLDGADVLQRSIAGHQQPLSLPAALLLDREGQACAFYRGPVSTGQVVRDSQSLSGSPAVFRDLAVPFPGRWFVHAFDPDLAAPVERLLELGRIDLAQEYLEEAVVPQAKGFARLSAGAMASNLGQQLIAEGNSVEALRALRSAVRLDPERQEALTRLAILCEAEGFEAEAAGHFRSLLRLSPDSLPAANSLAWLLATSGDPELRRPEEALRQAAAVCEATGFAMAEPLDTLAAAYAALGRFEEAVDAARRALSVAQEAGERATAERIEERLRLYEQGRPYVSKGSRRP